MSSSLTPAPEPVDQPVVSTLPKSQAELDGLLEQAAERGALRLLAHLGLENGHAARDIHELRGLLDAWRDARKTAWQTTIRVLTTGLLALLIVGAAIKLELMGCGQ